ncbi:hypothetical protein ACH3XW_0110 [Acanthocheilonema viteae]
MELPLSAKGRLEFCKLQNYPLRACWTTEHSTPSSYKQNFFCTGTVLFSTSHTCGENTREAENILSMSYPRSQTCHKQFFCNGAQISALSTDFIGQDHHYSAIMSAVTIF